MQHAPSPPVSTTRSALTPLLTSLRADFPQFSFAAGSDDHWDASGTVYYTADTSPCALLHEVSHALLGHRTYVFDIDLLQMERAAWQYARHTLAPRYAISVTEEDAEDALDTYRAWLHNRSLCPDCNLSGLQQPTLEYLCVLCGLKWRANPAKTRALRRFRQPA